MTRVLLLVPTSTYRAADFVDAAARLGVEIVVGSPRRQAMAHAMADRAIVLPLDRPAVAAEAVVGLHERAPLDAIVAVDDEGSLTAALAATRLGFPANRPAAVGATRDKVAARNALARAGLPQPDFRVVPPGEDAAAAAAGIGFPCVVKPPTLSASRGVIRVDDERSARSAAARARAILEESGDDGSSPLLVERFLPGPEVAVEALLSGGRLTVLAVFDKPEPLDGPYFEETIYTTPSRLPPADVTAVTDLVGRAAAAIGLSEGPLHGEVRPAGPGACVIELAARTIGGLCSRALDFGDAGTLEELVIKHSLGEPTGEPVATRASGVMMLPIPRAGRFEGVGGTARALDVPGITSLEVTVPRGRIIRPLPEGDRYLGFLFASTERAEQAEQALRLAHGLLDVRITAVRSTSSGR